jgi:hypothetical protein
MSKKQSMEVWLVEETVVAHQDHIVQLQGILKVFAEEIRNILITKINTMLKNILKLKGTQQLSKNEQKEIIAGISPQSGNCNCFCYRGGAKIQNSCKSYCPDGSMPGLMPGSSSNCAIAQF